MITHMVGNIKMFYRRNMYLSYKAINMYEYNNHIIHILI